MRKYEGLYTFDVDNHRYIPVGQSDGIIDCFKFEHESKEPLIKDEKARNVFREWADLIGAERFRVEHLCKFGRTMITGEDLTSEPVIELPGYIGEDSEIYTITELRGEEEE